MSTSIEQIKKTLTEIHRKQAVLISQVEMVQVALNNEREVDRSNVLSSARVVLCAALEGLNANLNELDKADVALSHVGDA